MVKRGHEMGQLDKREYERHADEADGGDDEDPGTFVHTSQEGLKGRKILKIGRRGPVEQSSAAVAAAQATAADSGKKNPFANVNLTAGTTDSTAAAAPFSFGPALVPPSASAPAPQFSFGSGSIPAPSLKASPSPSGFSFPSANEAASSLVFPQATTTTTTTTLKTAPSLSIGSSYAWNKQESCDAVRASGAYEATLAKLGPKCSDAGMSGSKYLRFGMLKMDAINKDKIVSHDAITAASTSDPSSGPDTGASMVVAASSLGGFAASGSAPSPAPAVGSSAANTSASPAPATEATEADDMDGIHRAVDPDWDDVIEIQGVRAFHLEDPKNTKSTSFAAFSAGTVRIQHHKGNDDNRILMRDKTGIKVQLNMKVTKEMNLEWKAGAPRKGVERGEVSFYGTNKEERGYELIRIQATAEVSKKLHAAMEATTK